MSDSRTSKSLKNIQTALIFYIINLILNLFSRKAFIDNLGTEVLGLNSTIVNLLGFLNLAEAGIGLAIAYNLYRPIFLDDKTVISEIISVQGWIYRKIAYFIIIISCLILPLFPFIFNKMDLPLWYAYSSFIVLLVSPLLGYFVNYTQVLLSADQKEYQVSLNVQGIKSIKILIQILCVTYFSYAYIYWLVVEFLMAIVVAISLNYTVKKVYPWLKTDWKNGKKLRNKYPGIIKKTKQLFVHKIASYSLNQTSSLIIYGFTSLTIVANYGNYMLIMMGVIAFINALMNGMTAGIGNMVAEGNKEKIKKIYWEVTSFRIWISSLICFCMYYLVNPFIGLWIGKEYLINSSAFILLLVFAYISMTRTNEIFLSAYGLYHDVWAPLVEAGLNIGLSIFLGYHFGLTGILLGVVISLIIIPVCWKGYFLYKDGFQDHFKEYIYTQSKYLLLIAFSFTLSSLLKKNISLNIINWGDFVKNFFVLVFVYSFISLVIFEITDYYFRTFSKRVIIQLHKAIKR